jgi:endonuclease YncB( thermonuclease family)
MSVAIETWNAATAAAHFRRRRRWRIAGTIFAGLFLLSIVADHLRARNPLTDWSRFDGRKCQFLRMIDGETIEVRDPQSKDPISISLLGIKPFDKPLSDKLLMMVNSELTGTTIILHLPPTQTRDESGQLTADAALDNGHSLAAELTEEGLTLSDHPSDSLYRAEIERAQSEARRKKTGMWSQ